MRKMRLHLDELVVDAFPTTGRAQAARGTVQGHSGLPGCEPAAGDGDVGMFSQFDINSNTGGQDHCICPRKVNESAAPC
jgi:hypothetical protein